MPSSICRAIKGDKAVVRAIRIVDFMSARFLPLIGRQRIKEGVAVNIGMDLGQLKARRIGQGEMINLRTPGNDNFVYTIGFGDFVAQFDGAFYIVTNAHVLMIK